MYFCNFLKLLYIYRPRFWQIEGAIYFLLKNMFLIVIIIFFIIRTIIKIFFL